MDFPVADEALKLWSLWLHEGNGIDLGYPHCSAEQRFGYGSGRKIYVSSNPQAEQTEQLMNELKRNWYHVYQSVVAYYYLRLSSREASKYCQIGRATFDKYLCTGLGWMEARLTYRNY